MSSHENLVFFNKEGDYLNFNYNNEREIFEGDLLFHENSTDTFKTIGIYMLDRIPSFEYMADNDSDLETRKFQLFNEYGMNFYGSRHFNEKITNVEITNNDPNFFSKWIYGNNFHLKFPLGSLIQFTVTDGFNDHDIYIVVDTKKDAFMVLSHDDNNNTPPLNTFGHVSGINAFGVDNYIDINGMTPSSNLSIWNEPDYHTRLFEGRKINIINSKKNDGIYTIQGTQSHDIERYIYSISESDISHATSSIIMEVITRTDVPKIYDNSLHIDANDKYRIELLGNEYPSILTSYREFKIIGTNDDFFYTVKHIPIWEEIVNLTYFDIGDQIIYEGLILECNSGYTHSYDTSITASTAYASPLDLPQWVKPTHIKTNEEIQVLYNGVAQLYLTTDHFYFEQEFLTQSSEITILSLMNRYENELSLFNLHHNYNEVSNTMDIILDYPSKYLEINFYENDLNTQIGTSSIIYENIHFLEENIHMDLNKDYSERFEYNIIIDDIDYYGIKIEINNLIYEVETQFVRVNNIVDKIRTIDRSLRKWLSINYLNLYRLGIDTNVIYTGNGNSPFVNSITFQSHYPNVPTVINKIMMGDHGIYHIEHSVVKFEHIGPYLNIDINGTDYGVESITDMNNNTDIDATLTKWINEHRETLILNNILTESVTNILKFDILDSKKELHYNININELDLPGINGYYIINKFRGNHGTLITSNEIYIDPIYGTVSSMHNFTSYEFAVGMVLSMNNTYWTWMNNEYNILQFTEDKIIYNYQGPYWNSIGTTPDLIGGEFDNNEFNTDFFLNYEEDNKYVSITHSISISDTMIDILYLQLTSYMYVLSEGHMTILDAMSGVEKISLQLNDNTYKKMMFNYIDNHIYIISDIYLTKINPINFTFTDIIPLSLNTIYDFIINNDGYIYLSFGSLDNIEKYNNGVITQLSHSGYKMTHDYLNNRIYTIRDNSSIIKIDMSDNITVYDNTIYPYLINLNTDIIYHDINDDSILLYSNNELIKFKFNPQSELSMTMGLPIDFIYSPINGEINISSNDNKYYTLLNNNISVKNTNGYGYLSFNNHDSDIYLSRGNNSVITLNDDIDTNVFDIERMEYNPLNKSIWGIDNTNSIITEIMVSVGVKIQPIESNYTTEDNMYGTLSPNYMKSNEIYIKTRDYVKMPMENYIGEQRVEYYWKWYDDTVDSFFFYDFSGEQLSVIDHGSYSYTGIKPLTNAVLNKKANRDITKIDIPEWQQTVFDEIWYKIPYLNETVDTSLNISPLELFIGFQSDMEGTDNNILQLYKREDITVIYNADVNNKMIFDTIEDIIDGEYNRYGIIKITNNSNHSFLNKGFKIGQLICLNFKDLTNNMKQYVSYNEDSVFKIKYISNDELILDFITENDELYLESTHILDYPEEGSITYLQLKVTVLDKELARFNVYGQTEDEDERFRIELNNVGKLIEPDDIFIFKDYDIQEGGMDWRFMNIKRKEMLMMKHLIYPYIGAYKSIINAINYFGYGDLQLNEYYKNVNPSSPLFNKLHKVEIPKIFDNQYEGWSETDFIKETYPNKNYEDTNLFNLTYFITDKEGNNILHYSLDEIVIKLQGLKYWLKRNIIPLTHKILDITGMMYFKDSNYILHRLHDVKTYNIYQNLTPITFRLNEAYLNPINTGSTVYTCVLDFYSIIPGIGHEPHLLDKPLPYNGVELELPDYFDIKIRTYKTYLEWEPFKIYNIGDQVKYYDKLYESVIDGNRTKNPRKYNGCQEWSANIDYEEATIVKYQREYFSYIGTTQSINNPPLGNPDWYPITEWIEIDYKPVQHISEYRKGDDLLPFSFTIDSNIDPFITIDVTCDNGYGEIYSDRKSYEIRGLNDFGKSSVRDMNNLPPMYIEV